MTREEAAKHFEKYIGNECYTIFHQDACRMAVAALRAQQTPAKLDRSRWEGCEWCNGRYCDNCFWQLKMKDTARCKRCVDKSGWTPIVSYCSNCGKPQTEQAWEELERRINSGTTYRCERPV